MSLKDFVRNITPAPLLEWNRKRKKSNRNKTLADKAKSGHIITQQKLETDLRNAGIQAGDIVLVHSSLSRIGYLENGAKTFVDALMNVLTEEGTLLMPTSPNAVFQYDFIKSNKQFDVLNTHSATGKITEYFRTQPGVLRSWHPTEPVSAWGKNAHYFIKDHFNQLTPYNSQSPFFRVSEQKGKLLYVGVTLTMAGTNLHTLEDAVDFKFPVYANEIFEVEITDPSGKKHVVKTKVHNPEFSKKRKCDELIPLFEKEGVMQKVKIGEAECLLADAHGFLETMINAYQQDGITMYTPNGSK